MKKQIILFLIIARLYSTIVSAQTLDTTINVGGGNQLHFTIIKGKRAPIIFESGFGNYGDVWNGITKQIAQATGATIITYDRLSNGDNKKNYLISLEDETKALEMGLAKLGYANKEIMLVSHSLGGMYSSFYASRHPNEVKAIVLIDAPNVCSLTDHFKIVDLSQHDTIEEFIFNILTTVKKNPMPKNIPLLDIVADTHFDDSGNPDTTWLICHKKFVAESPLRKSLLAFNVGHTIYVDNPPLVIDAIIAQYANFLAPQQKASILEKGYTLALEMVNESKKNEVKCGQTEDDLTTWGYSLLEKNEVEKAIEVFKLNVMMYPNGWNTYDCLAEAYLKAGNKQLAIMNYKKSLELNSKNENAIKILEQLK